MINFEMAIQDCCQLKVQACYVIKFSDICLNVPGKENLPTFGPGYIYFYAGPQKNTYVGKLMLSIDTKLIATQSLFSKKNKLSIFPLTNEEEYWRMEQFNVHLILMNVDFLHFQRNQIKFRLECEGKTLYTFWKLIQF
jgi:hypothetical protein